MKTGKYYVVVPDPGEYQRALTEEGDMMFAVPQARMQGMMHQQHPEGVFGRQFGQPSVERVELRVHLGEQVQAGQVLTVLANHQALDIEGRGFKQEAALLERAADVLLRLQSPGGRHCVSLWAELELSLRACYEPCRA